jgi:hypothetical protein
MSNYEVQSGYSVADLDQQDRAAFISRTYSHLAGSVLAFIALEFALLHSPAVGLMEAALGSGKLAILVVLFGFMGISWIAQKMADDSSSPAVQYAGLGLYIVAEAFFFLPLILMASVYAGPTVLPIAAAITGAMFLGITVVAFTTRKDFSFLGAVLKIGGLVMMGVVVASIIFGLQLGVLFSGVMVLFASAAILYSTSNILHRYGPTQHVAAALSLFASVMLLFWYVLRLLMGSRRN